MQESTKKQLREEWKKESRLIGANMPDYVCEWFFSRLDIILVDKKSKVEKLERDMSMYPKEKDVPLGRYETVILYAGDSQYNKALSDVLSILNE